MSEQPVWITSETFRVLARRGMGPADAKEYVVLKAAGLRAKQIDVENRVVPFVLSNARMDREGDNIEVGGWDLTDYVKNPVVLWAHSHDLLPIGKALRTFIEGGNLRADDQFAGPELNPFADTVFRMIDAEFLKSCSVGFQPTEWEMSDTGVRFLRQTLLEHSVVPVPAHQDALVAARAKGIDTAPLRVWAEQVLDNPKSLAGALRADVERLYRSADPRARTSSGSAEPVLTIIESPRRAERAFVVDGIEVTLADFDRAVAEALEGVLMKHTGIVDLG